MKSTYPAIAVINYRQQSRMSSTIHVLACNTEEERDLYLALIQEDDSISEALMLDKLALPPDKGITRIK